MKEPGRAGDRDSGDDQAPDPGPCPDGQLPTADLCGDGLDNDCDGETDEQCAVVSVRLRPLSASVVGPTGAALLRATLGGVAARPAEPPGANLTLTLDL